jgi:hypothetical protein
MSSRPLREVNFKLQHETKPEVFLKGRSVMVRVATGKKIALVLMSMGAVLTAGCEDDSTSPAVEESALLSIIPQGGTTGVDPNGPVVIEFTHPMQQGMEEYADVHEGDVEGPLVEGSWSWNAEFTKLTFTPFAPLKSQTQYVVHIGGGMMDEGGNPINYGQHGLGMGGHWMTQEMHQGGQHGYGGGMGGGMGGGTGMGSGWTHPTNGSYGMVFTFTTA